MNPAVNALYAEYLEHTGGDKAAAASLALAAVLVECRPAEPSAEAADRALSVTEAAARLGVSPLTVYRLCAQGKLTHHKVGSRAIRILPADIDAYQKGQAAGTDRPPAGRFTKLRLRR